MRGFWLGLGICLLVVSVVAAVFSLHNAYTADSAVDTREPRCGQHVHLPGHDCVTSYGESASGRVSYEEAKKTREDTAISKAWLFGVELLGTIGIALYAGAIVCIAGAIWPRRARFPMLLAGVLIPAAAFGLAFWPAQEHVQAVSPVPPGALSFLNFPYFPIVIISVAALAAVKTRGWMQE